ACTARHRAHRTGRRAGWLTEAALAAGHGHGVRCLPYLLATRRYRATDSGANTAIIATQLNTAYGAACSIGQPPDSAAPSMVLPNSSRVAWMTAANGCHVANAYNGPRSDCNGTNAAEMKLTGNSQINPALWATSTLRANSPMNAPTQDNAQANSNITRYPSAASPNPVLICQPTSRPHTDITIRARTLITRSEVVRPSTTASRDIGNDRNRSMMPFCRSLAKPTTVNAELNATVCAKIPAIRYSRYAAVLPASAIAPPKT